MHKSDLFVFVCVLEAKEGKLESFTTKARASPKIDMFSKPNKCVKLNNERQMR